MLTDCFYFRSFVSALLILILVRCYRERFFHRRTSRRRHRRSPRNAAFGFHRTGCNFQRLRLIYEKTRVRFDRGYFIYCRTGALPRIFHIRCYSDDSFICRIRLNEKKSAELTLMFPWRSNQAPGNSYTTLGNYKIHRLFDYI